jgi:hypothetical protein
VVFDDAVIFGGGTAIESNVVFNGNVTQGTTLYFDGDVTLAHERSIDLTANAITLKKGRQILVADIPVLAAESDTVLTPTAGGSLTTGAPYRPGTDEESYLGDKTLTVRTQPITVTSGSLRIAGGGVLESALAGGIVIDANGALILDTGGILALAENVGGGAFTVTLGATAITGENNAQSRLTAVNGPVTLSQNTISGSGSTLAITGDEFANADIVVGATPLDIAGANLDLSANGMLTITTNGTAYSVRLQAGPNPGKITLGTDFDTSTTLLGTLATAVTLASNGTMSGNGTIRGAIDLDSNQGQIGDLSASAIGGPLVIWGVTTGNAVVISAGAALE